VTPEQRRRAALAAAGLPDGAFVRVHSYANEVWVGDDVVVRIAHLGLVGGELGRLGREAAIVARLPREARYPEIVAVGRDDAQAWMITRRVPGVQLARAWPALTTAERERATRELAAALAAVHATPCDGIADDIRPPHTLALAPLLELCGKLPDRGLAEAVAQFVRARWGAFDDADRGLVHGDPHLENVLWHDGHISALLDFEWSRPSWIHCDLEILLAVARDPKRFVAADLEALLDPAQFEDVPRWLREACPQWFAHPRLADRLVVLEISRLLGGIEDDPISGTELGPEVRALLESAP